jgi:hypothetical protein
MEVELLLRLYQILFSPYQRWLDEFHLRLTGCGLVKRRRRCSFVCRQKVLAIELGSIFQQEKTFDETKYQNEEVIAPGTVITAGNCTDVKKVVEPVLQRDGGSILLYQFIAR